MSWKGFKKALERMPHQLQSKIGRGSKTVDAEFDELKVKFEEMERVSKDLFSQTAQFRDAIRGILVYQSAYLEQVLAMYRPISTDPEGNAQPVGSYTDEGASPELLRVAEEFRNRVTTIRENTESRLGRMDVSVVGPIQELMAMMRNIHKVINKRDHKLVDYDRYRHAVEKAEAKESTDGQRRLPEERAYQKHGAQYQESSRQYNYFNDMLKAELKQLLDLRQAFIDPIFLKFFRIQYDMYNSMFKEFSDAARSCPALDLATPVLIGWQPKWTRAEQNLQSIDLYGHGQMNVMPFEFDGSNKGMFDSVKGTFRKKDKAAPASASSTFTGVPPPGASPSMSQQQLGSGTYGNTGTKSPALGPSGGSPYGSLGHAAQPAPYIAPAAENKSPYGTYMSSSTQAPMPNQQGYSPMPPAAQPAPPSYNSGPPAGGAPGGSSAPAAKRVRALYDFEGQEAGDLTIHEGDIIELIERTNDANDWWTGRIGTRKGVFPGNYVSEI
ncbi:BAR adaptor protein Hob1 [Coemansia sp. RSA 2618]|nr:BAR adaptor protein Hob1 [Coemansia sp. RSA 2618]